MITRLKTLLVSVAVFAPVGCDPTTGMTDGGTVPGDGGSDAGPVPLPCVSPLAGTAPFAMRLGGTVELVRFDGTAAGSAEEQLDVFFPEGRVPGATAWIAHEVSWPYDAITAQAVTLDASGGASFGLVGSNGRELAIHGELLGPDGGAHVSVSLNLASPSTDVGDHAGGTAMLCPESAPIDPELRVASTERLSPLSPIHLGPNSPWMSAPVVGVRIDGAPIVVDATEGGPPWYTDTPVQLVTLRARSAFPPGATIALSTTSTDVLGRTYEIVGGEIPVLSTSDVVVDLSFDTPPPSGSVVGAEVLDGQLVIGDGAGAVHPSPVRVMVALGEPPAGTSRLRYEHRVLCGSSGASLRVGLVTTDGRASVVELPCETSDVPFTSATLDVPGPGPLHFVLDRDPTPERPQWSPSYSWMSAYIDALAFE